MTELILQDAVGIQRGIKSIFRAIKLGDSSIREGFQSQLAELANDAEKKDGIAGGTDAQLYPSEFKVFNLLLWLTPAAIIGELGTPWDLKESSGLLGMAKGKVHRSDYAEPSKVIGLTESYSQI